MQQVTPTSEQSGSNRIKPDDSGTRDGPPDTINLPGKLTKSRLVLRDLSKAWSDIPKDLSASDLLERRRVIVEQAGDLGYGDELLSFFEFLKEQGCNDLREEMIQKFGGQLFSGPDAALARRWLVGVEDKELREKLCRVAGTHFIGDGLKAFIGAFDPDAKCQGAILTGYCVNMVESDPNGAAKAFVDNLPPNVSYDGYVELMKLLPAAAEFAKIASTIPEDKKPIAKAARAALLGSWSTFSPEAAAQYVISNTSLASPEQMRVVIEKWAQKAPEVASHWLDGAPDGPPRDEGLHMMVAHWIKAGQPYEAWSHVGRIGNAEKRVQVATQVFKTWETVDHAAAVKAWEELFPPAR